MKRQWRCKQRRNDETRKSPDSAPPGGSSRPRFRSLQARGVPKSTSNLQDAGTPRESKIYSQIIEMRAHLTVYTPSRERHRTPMYFTATSGRESSGVCRFPQAPLGFSFFFQKDYIAKKCSHRLGPRPRPPPTKTRPFVRRNICVHRGTQSHTLVSAPVSTE